MSRLIRIYSRRFRERYGDEIAVLLARSERPVRDRIDLILHALVERTETTMQRMSMMLFAAVIIAAISLIAFGYTLAELAGGLRDVPRHWWSTLPLIGLALAGVMGVIATARLHPDR